MSNDAKVALTGRLTKDPTKKDWQGTTVVSFTIAVNTTKKEGDKYVADFYNVSVWGKAGEFILPRIWKGAMVQVYGDLILQPYKDKNSGEEKYSLSVRASDVTPLSSKKDNSSQTTDDGGPYPF